MKRSLTILGSLALIGVVWWGISQGVFAQSTGPITGPPVTLSSEPYRSDFGPCLLRDCTAFSLPSGVMGVFAPGGTHNNNRTKWNGHAGGLGDILLAPDAALLMMDTVGSTNFTYISKLGTGNTFLGVTSGNYVGFNFSDVLKAWIISKGSGGAIRFAGVLFSELGSGDSTDGTLIFCSDCNATCTAGASTGRMCARYNGAWNAL